MKNIKYTNYFVDNVKKKGKIFKILTVPLAVAIIATSFAGCSSNNKSQEIEQETSQIIQYVEQETTFVDETVNIKEYAGIDFTGFTDIKMFIGDVEIGPSKYDMDDECVATVNLSIEPRENCSDFICTFDKNDVNPIIAFEQFMKGEGNSQEIEFINITGEDFVWKTNRIEDPKIHTYDYDDALPEEIDNDKYKQYINSLNHYKFETMTFEICSTRNTETYLFRYDYENNIFYKYDLTTFIGLDTKDWKGQGKILGKFSNWSMGYESLFIDRTELNEVIIHGEKCSVHPASKEVVKLLRRDMK